MNQEALKFLHRVPVWEVVLLVMKEVLTHQSPATVSEAGAQLASLILSYGAHVRVMKAVESCKKLLLAECSVYLEDLTAEAPDLQGKSFLHIATNARHDEEFELLRFLLPKLQTALMTLCSRGSP